MKPLSDASILRCSIIISWLVWAYTHEMSSVMDNTSNLKLISDTTFLPESVNISLSSLITYFIGLVICLCLLAGYFFPVASMVGCALTLLISAEASILLYVTPQEAGLNHVTGEWGLFAVGTLLMRHDWRKVKRSVRLIMT